MSCLHCSVSQTITILQNDMAEERKTVMEVYLTRKSLIGSERKKEKNNEVDNGYCVRVIVLFRPITDLFYIEFS